jgi:prepilin-type processing-associated H-X9-DG protein
MFANESDGEKWPSMLKYKVNTNCTEPNTRNQFFDGKSVYPEYLSDVNIILCPSDADAETTSAKYWPEPDGTINPCDLWEVSYKYFGWALVEDDFIAAGEDISDPACALNTSTVLAIGTEIVTGAAAYFPGNPEGAFENDIDSGERTIHRLREGIERFFISDINNAAASAKAQSELVVMFDGVWTPSVGAGESYFNHIPGGGNVLFMDGHVEFIKYPDAWPVCCGYVNVMDFVFETLG